MKLPIKINPFELCDRGAVLEGPLEVKQLTRLAELLSDTEGKVTAHLEFGRDQHGQRTVTGWVEAHLNLVCQRCGKAVSCDIKLDPKLCPVRDDSAAKRLTDYEPLWVADEEDLVLTAEVVEEELLLSLPMIPKHEPQCPV